LRERFLPALIAEKSAHSMFCPCHSLRRARTKHRLAAPPSARRGSGRLVLSYGESGSGASLGALSVNPSLTGWRILRDCSPFDRGNYVQRRCGHLPLVMAVGPTCVLLSDEACCVLEAVCFWLLYAVGVFRAPRGVRTVDLIFSEALAARLGF